MDQRMHRAHLPPSTAWVLFSKHPMSPIQWKDSAKSPDGGNGWQGDHNCLPAQERHWREAGPVLGREP